MLCVDDLRPLLGCYGDPHAHTPNIDRLAKRGMLFKRAYCQQSISAPSRISFLTGLRPETLDIYTLGTPLKNHRPGTQTLPLYLRDQGYTTVSIGKVFHHEGDRPESWTREIRPYQKYSRGYVTPKGQSIVDQQADNKVDAEGIHRGRGPTHEIATDEQIAGHHDCLVRDHTVQELTDLAAAGEPFFLAAGFKKPHLPFTAPRWAWDLYDRDKLPVPTQTSFPTDAPPWHRNVSGNGAIWELAAYPGAPTSSPLPDQDARTLIHGYYACVSYVDALIGEVLDTLDRTGMSETTTVVLWGDHGFKLGEFGSFCKHTNYEVDTHAPLIIAGPGVPEGQQTDALCEFVDVMPTIMEMTGHAPPQDLDGLSLTPLFTEPDRDWKPAAFSQYPRGGGMTGGRSLMGDAMRTDRYRYIAWIDRQTGERVAEELYDHGRAGQPSANLVDDPSHAEGLEACRRLHAGGWKQARARATATP
ncbi:sulfatase [Mucisphaera calidilacus]|uniref:Choline-sulfatase n=1 Tax=Mucisphaera calidilacus TaxID=2527982 RepID=A0A518BX07_9BACT|nr:sulfatase [Mucisphaera calidilacus]QDU71474.1 Choline-sulfatase [Mucisphaera calidilacus]